MSALGTVIAMPKRFGPALTPGYKRRLCFRGRPPASVTTLKPAAPKPETADSLYREGSAIDYAEPLRAEAIYRRALDADPRHGRARVNLGNCLYRTGRGREAMGEYSKAIDASPELPEAYYNLGFLELERGRAQVAIGLFEKSLSLDPDFADAWYNLGLARKAVSPLGASSLPARRAFDRYLSLADPVLDRTFIDCAKRMLGKG